MKRGKILLLSLLSVFMLFLVTGCTNKTAITAEDFKIKMEEADYVVVDATEQFAQYDFINKVYVAASADSTYQIEFYELADEENTISFYNNNKTIFEDSKSGVHSETTVNLGNYSKYTLSTGGMYKVLSRIDNTVIYVDVDDSYKDTVDGILDDFGY